MLNEVMNMFKMEKNKIYNIFNQKNLKHLVRSASIKRKKREEILYLEEEAMELYLEKVSKNWKTRRKKPLGKLVEVKLYSLSTTEYYIRKI
jgi:hypothetical protein